jgi:hypothetical protein
MSEPLVTIHRIAQVIGRRREGGKPVSTMTVYRMVRRGLPHRKEFGATMFRESEVVKFLESRRGGVFIDR